MNANSQSLIYIFSFNLFNEQLLNMKHLLFAFSLQTAQQIACLPNNA